MSRQASTRGPNGPVQLFVSYSSADERWATWIAWELEAAGYGTMLQAWDFVPGTNFIDFLDRGVSEAAAVVAVLSRHYLNSMYGRLEWQAALQADPGDPAGRLIPVRVEECQPEGLLATVTYIDLVGVTDPRQARDLLLSRIGDAVTGWAKREVGYTQAVKTIVGQVLHAEEMQSPKQAGVPRTRRAPVSGPAYPPALPHPAMPRAAVTLLHLAGPRFGRGPAASAEHVSTSELQARIWADVTRLTATGMPKPDLMVVTGDLTESGSLRECDEALTLLTGLRALLGLEPHRVAIVPGGHDITLAASRAYFADCEADGVQPQLPYWPKWRHFASLFEEFYRGLEGPGFKSVQPWTLFRIEDLRVVIAGLNSTMASSHRQEDHYGWIGEAQAAWFADRLASFERDGWLRIGVICHDPAPGDVPAERDAMLLRDAGTLDRLLGPRLNLLLHGPGPGGEQVAKLGSGLLVMSVAAAGRHQFLRLAADGLERWGTRHGGDENAERLPLRWHVAGATFPAGGVGHVKAGTEEETPAAGLKPVRAASSVTQVRFSRAGEQLATMSNDGIVRLWQPRTGQQLRQLIGTANRLISVLFSPVDDRIATVSNDGGVHLWNAASGAYEREMNVDTDHLWAEAFSPAGDVLATANDDDTVRLWNCTTGRHLSTFAEHSGRVRSIAFSPDGRMLATGCDDRSVRLWDVSERTCLAILTGHADRVNSVMFSPDGAMLASASNDGTARLWNVALATQTRTLTRHQGRLWSAAFNSNGTLLAAGSDDPTIPLWDPRTGAELRTLAGHTRRVWSVAFSPDGTLLASAGDDGTARLWNTAAGEPSPLRLTLLGLPHGWAALAPDGRYKQEGDVTAPFWHVLRMCRFEPGELDSYLTSLRRVALDKEF